MSMQQGYFITGTDTGVGKTWATVALMRYFKNQGKTVAGMKPVASGCIVENGKRVNEDALLIQANSSVSIEYELINPYAYSLPVSPHLAGHDNPVNLEKVIAGFELLKQQADIILVEGAGGWYAPINNNQDISDLAKSLALPVIMIVAVRLGCISHAKLTAEAIDRSGLPCAGWIAVCSEPSMLFVEHNIGSIEQRLDAPLLGVLPYREPADFDFLSRQLHL